MAGPVLIKVVCPQCGAGMRIDPRAEVVTCSYCNVSSSVHRPKEPIAPAPPTYGHIHLSEKQLRSGSSALVATLIAIFALLLAGGVAAAVLLVNRPVPVHVSPAGPGRPDEAPGGPLSPSCGKAVQCCKVVVSISADPSAIRACEAMWALSDEDCAKQHKTLRSSAKSMGRSCP